MNMYQGTANTPSFGKTLSLNAPTATTLTPSEIAALLVAPSAPITITAPTGTAVIVTQGQPMTVTWTPFAADTFVAYVAGSPPVCRLDPMAGTFTIPGATTQLFTTGTFKTMLFSAVNRRIIGVKINGTPKTIRGYATSASAANFNVQ